jgi:hypothetical protein
MIEQIKQAAFLFQFHRLFLNVLPECGSDFMFIHLDFIEVVMN